METVVLVLTDVQGSTRLWQDESVAMDAAMARHHEIVHGAVAEHGGWRPVDQGEGDAVFAAFRSPTAALAAVVQMQRLLAAEPWPTSVPLKVRIGVHVGEVTERGGNLFGDPVNRCARLRGLGHGGQTLLSAPVYELVRDKLPPGASVSDLGEHRMKDLTRPEHVWQLDLDGITATFPALASLDRALHNLPVQRSPLIGRDADLAAVLRALDTHRLVTLTGFGGMGKTRLSLQAAAELADGEGDGVWFVDLAGTTDPTAVPGLIGHVTGLGGSDAESVISAMSGQQLLLVLDNLEQVLDCAQFIGHLLDSVQGVKVLATSREPLRIKGEQELSLAPLALPPEGSAQDAASLSAYAAVQLFVDRAVAVKVDFAVTNENAPAVAAICQRLDGHPLAIELAAARVRMMTPQALLPRLDSALTVLTGGGRDLPGRHQTLRATIAWSYDLLEPEERLLLDRLSVFAGPVAFEHVETVCGDELDVFSALASLVEKSLVRTSLSDDGEDRYGLLASIKAYTDEQLAASGATEGLRDRHAAHMVSEATLRPPYTNAQWRATQRRVRVLFDELAEAWGHVQRCGDLAQVRAFPVAFFAEVFGRTNDASGLDVVIASSDEPTFDLVVALNERHSLYAQAGLRTPDELTARLLDVALVVGRPEGLALSLASFEGLDSSDAQQLRARIAQIDVHLALVPKDSPYGRERLQDLRDNMAGVLLTFVDPPLAEAASARCLAMDPGDSIALTNKAMDYGWRGEWQQLLDLTAPVLERGPVRTEFTWTHMAVSLAARALVELGRPQEALDALEPWAFEVGRRGWQLPLEADATARAAALLALDRAAEALALVDGLPPAGLLRATGLVRLRVERAAGRSQDPAEAAAFAASLEDALWLRLPFYLSALVEQALREPSEQARQLLLDRIAEFNTPLVLPFGYQADLERLLSEA